MRSTTTTLLAIAACVSTALGDLEARAYKGEEVMSLDFVKQKGPYHHSAEASKLRAANRSLRKRQAPFVATLGNRQLLYYANITVGNPQSTSIELQIDSGSSDVWVEAMDSDLCTTTDQCDQGGVFDYTKSKTFKVVNKGAFSIAYVDGTKAKGDYFTDDFHIGGKTVKNLQMGIARTTDIGEGIMGIGYDTNEAIVSNNGGDLSLRYPSFIDQLVAQKFINTKAYSLWLNDLDSSTGSILFGGIDTEKYQGKLSGLQLQPDVKGQKPTEFAVVFTGFSFTDNKGKSTSLDDGELPIAAVLDSGSSFIVLPNNLADAAAGVLNGQYSQETSTYIVDCSMQFDSTYTFDFTFGNTNGPKIRVPLNELVHPLVDDKGKTERDRHGQTICQLGIVPSGTLQTDQKEPPSYLFGDSFLRSAYVVYNLDEDMVYIAPTVFNTTKSNVLAISTNGVPDADGTVQGPSVQPSGTGYVHGGYPTGVKKSAAARMQQLELSLLALSTLLAFSILF